MGIDKTFNPLKLGLFGLFFSSTILINRNYGHPVSFLPGKSNRNENCIPGEECVRVGNMNHSFVPSEPRACGEEIFHFSSTESWFVTKMIVYGLHYVLVPIDMFGKELGGHMESILNFRTTHGVRALKVCGSCDDFRESSGSIKGFDEYCGKNVYGSNETMTGIIFLPIDESTKSVQSGDLSAAMWLHGYVSNQGPSEILPRSAFMLLGNIFETVMAFFTDGMKGAYKTNGKCILNYVGAWMLASRGVVVVAPDYMGYGGNTKLYKGPGMGLSYVTSSIPIWLASKSVVKKESDGKSKLLNKAFVHGASEGSMGAMPIAHALHEMGENTIAYPAAMPNYDGSIELMKRMYIVMRGKFPLIYYSFFAYCMTGFSHISPHSNVPFGQGLASELGEKDLDLIVNNEISFSKASDLLVYGFSSSPYCLKNGTGCPLYLNPVIAKSMSAVAHLNPKENTEYLPCQSKNRAPELSGLCRELELSSSAPYFESAEYPVKICHYPGDNVSHFEDMTAKYPDNKNLQLLPSQEEWDTAEKERGFQFSHGSSALTCNLYAVIDVIANQETK